MNSLRDTVPLMQRAVILLVTIILSISGFLIGAWYHIPYETELMILVDTGKITGGWIPLVSGHAAPYPQWINSSSYEFKPWDVVLVRYDRRSTHTRDCGPMVLRVFDIQRVGHIDCSNYEYVVNQMDNWREKYGSYDYGLVEYIKWLLWDNHGLD